MSDLGDREELVGYLVKTTRLTPPEAARVVDETLAFLTETPEAFIRRRHYALQAEGLSNPAIFERVAAELAQWRFRAPPYTARQIRRVIYG
jgi:hypothetical protein